MIFASFDLSGDTVDDFQVDLEGQKVKVTSKLSVDQITATLKKSGKAVSYVGVA